MGCACSTAAKPPAPPNNPVATASNISADPLANIRDTPDGVKADFRIGDLLGKGSFGNVYKAVNKKTGEVVAVKVMDRQKIKATSIHREWNVLEHTGEHPYVVGYKGTYKTKESVSFVLELMEGGELFDRLIRRGAYTEAEARVPFRHVAEALAYLHSRGIIHRDLKPENILLKDDSENPVLKIADFGLSQLIGQNERLLKVCGTWAYAAPEMSDPARPGYDCRFDCFSFGVILFVVLSGYHPFDPTGTLPVHEIKQRARQAQFDFNQDEWTHISDRVKDLIRRLIVKDPEQRYDSATMLKHPWFSDAVDPHVELIPVMDEERRIIDVSAGRRRQTPSPRPEVAAAEEAKDSDRRAQPLNSGAAAIPDSGAGVQLTATSTTAQSATMDRAVHHPVLITSGVPHQLLDYTAMTGLRSPYGTATLLTANGPQTVMWPGVSVGGMPTAAISPQLLMSLHPHGGGTMTLQSPQILGDGGQGLQARQQPGSVAMPAAFPHAAGMLSPQAAAAQRFATYGLPGQQVDPSSQQHVIMVPPEMAAAAMSGGSAMLPDPTRGISMHLIPAEDGTFRLIPVQMGPYADSYRNASPRAFSTPTGMAPSVTLPGAFERNSSGVSAVLPSSPSGSQHTHTLQGQGGQGARAAVPVPGQHAAFSVPAPGLATIGESRSAYQGGGQDGGDDVSVDGVASSHMSSVGQHSVAGSGFLEAYRTADGRVQVVSPLYMAQHGAAQPSLVDSSAAGLASARTVARRVHGSAGSAQGTLSAAGVDDPSAMHPVPRAAADGTVVVPNILRNAVGGTSGLDAPSRGQSALPLPIAEQSRSVTQRPREECGHGTDVSHAATAADVVAVSATAGHRAHGVPGIVSTSPPTRHASSSGGYGAEMAACSSADPTFSGMTASPPAGDTGGLPAVAASPPGHPKASGPVGAGPVTQAFHKLPLPLATTSMAPAVAGVHPSLVKSAGTVPAVSAQDAPTASARSAATTQVESSSPARRVIPPLQLALAKVINTLGRPLAPALASQLALFGAGDVWLRLNVQYAIYLPRPALELSPDTVTLLAAIDESQQAVKGQMPMSVENIVRIIVSTLPASVQGPFQQVLRAAKGMPAATAASATHADSAAATAASKSPTPTAPLLGTDAVHAIFTRVAGDATALPRQDRPEHVSSTARPDSTQPMPPSTASTPTGSKSAGPAASMLPVSHVSDKAAAQHPTAAASAAAEDTLAHARSAQPRDTLSAADNNDLGRESLPPAAAQTHRAPLVALPADTCTSVGYSHMLGDTTVVNMGSGSRSRGQLQASPIPDTLPSLTSPRDGLRTDMASAGPLGPIKLPSNASACRPTSAQLRASVRIDRESTSEDDEADLQRPPGSIELHRAASGRVHRSGGETRLDVSTIASPPRGSARMHQTQPTGNSLRSASPPVGTEARMLHGHASHAPPGSARASRFEHAAPVAQRAAQASTAGASDGAGAVALPSDRAAPATSSRSLISPSGLGPHKSSRSKHLVVAGANGEYTRIIAGGSIASHMETGHHGAELADDTAGSPRLSSPHAGASSLAGLAPYDGGMESAIRVQMRAAATGDTPHTYEQHTDVSGGTVTHAGEPQQPSAAPLARPTSSDSVRRVGAGGGPS